MKILTLICHLLLILLGIAMLYDPKHGVTWEIRFLPKIIIFVNIIGFIVALIF